MEKYIAKYVNNLKKLEYIRNDEKLLVHTDDFLSFYKIKSQYDYQIYLDNITILDQFFYKVKEKSIISLLEFNALQEFAIRIFNPPVILDVSLSLEIHEFLLKQAHVLQNKNFIVQEIYYLMLGYTVSEIKFYADQYAKLSDEILTYKDQYFQFDNKTRELYCKAYSNIAILYDSNKDKYMFKALKHYQNTLDFFNKKEIREANPEIKFDLFIFSVYRNIANYIYIFRENIECDNSFKDFVLYSIQYVYDNYKKFLPLTRNNNYSVMIFHYYESLYYQKKITLEKLIQHLYELKKPDEENPYSSYTCNKILSVSPLYAFYVNKLTVNSEEKVKLIKNNSNDLLKYLCGFPNDIFHVQYGTAFLRNLNYICANLDTKAKEKILSALILLFNFETSVHSIMVGNIACTIFDKIMVSDSSFFDELINEFGSAKKLRKIIYNSCLYHDIGKLFILDTINNFGRKINDAEFERIKQHPLLSSNFLKSQNLSQVYVDVAYFHHKWYDNTKGYPNDLNNSKYKKIIDLVTICDSLDAGSDNLGRNYTKAKSIDSLIKELNNQSNTRYSKELIDFISDDKYIEYLQVFITTKRTETYVQIFKSIKSKKAIIDFDSIMNLKKAID